VKKQIFKSLSWIGAIMTVIGSVRLILGFFEVLNFEDYAFGISAGVRVLGSVAIAGCLVSAIGFWGLEDSEPR
jgi:hypothetical protein